MAAQVVSDIINEVFEMKRPSRGCAGVSVPGVPGSLFKERASDWVVGVTDTDISP
jgi:hypothetical protein